MNFQWHLTNRCNLRCRHCYQSEFRDPASADLLALAHRLVSDLSERSSSTVINLTGGEPLLLGEELYRLLGYLDQAVPVEELMVITNGLLLDRINITRLSKFPKLTTIKVSLEGATPGTNDWIRGKGVFDRVFEVLRRLRDTGRFQVIVMYTLTRGNVHQVLPLLELVEEESLDGLMVERFIPEGQGRTLADGVLSRDQWMKFGADLTQWCEVELPLAVLSPYRAFWVKLGKDRDLLGTECNLSESYCILPGGTLLPCRRFVYPLGDLSTESLWTIIDHSPILQAVRDKSRLKGQCGICSHHSCYGCRALGYAYFRDPFAEDFLCFESGE